MREASVGSSSGHMKRRILALALFLVSGALVNVAVAWGLALAIKFNPEPSVVKGPRR